MSEKFVLLFGLPRSGTTWLGKIFDSHPGTLYRHEPDSVDRIELPLIIESVQAGMLDVASDYVQRITASRALKVAGKKPLFSKSYLSGINLFRYASGVMLSRGLSRAGLSVPAFGAPVIYAKDGAIIWKSIESLGRLSLFLDVLPEARAIHIVRHPCGQISSVIRGERRGRFDDKSAASEDYGILEMLLNTRAGENSGLTMSELRDMYPEERLAWRWAMFNDKAIVETEANPCVCTVSYDDMCAQPLEKSQQLMRFSNLAFDSQVEKFVRSSTRSDRRNYYGVYRDPVKAASSWQDDIDPRMIDRIVEVARHSLTWKCLFETGYERTEPKSDNGEVP